MPGKAAKEGKGNAGRNELSNQACPSQSPNEGVKQIQLGPRNQGHGLAKSLLAGKQQGLYQQRKAHYSSGVLSPLKPSVGRGSALKERAAPLPQSLPWQLPELGCKGLSTAAEGRGWGLRAACTLPWQL